jgi:MoaA/NifB/PqqE/SkfB family radical SAM enzyme
MCDTHSIYNRDFKPKRKLLPVEIIGKIVAQSVPGLKEIIPSTMGEPLLYKDFEKIIDITKKYNIKINLTTNGTFPRLGARRWGELILPVASDVKISINGFSKETNEAIMVGINHEKQIENIKTFVQVRDQIRRQNINNPTVTLQVTFMEMNYRELTDLLCFAVELGIDRIKGHHLWVTWPQLETQSLRRNEDSIRRWNEMVDRLFEQRRQLGSNIKLDNFYKLQPKGETLIPDDWVCPFAGGEAWIDWDGTFNVCCAPDNLRKTLGYYGNVFETNFMDLWQGKKYKNFVRNWGNYQVCQNCNMRKPRTEKFK